MRHCLHCASIHVPSFRLHPRRIRRPLLASGAPPRSYQDGGKAAAQLQEYAARKRLRQLPSPLEFFSYLFAAGNLLAGPFFEASDFYDYVQRKVGAGMAWGGGAGRGGLFVGCGTLQLPGWWLVA